MLTKTMAVTLTCWMTLGRSLARSYCQSLSVLSDGNSTLLLYVKKENLLTGKLREVCLQAWLDPGLQTMPLEIYLHLVVQCSSC